MFYCILCRKQVLNDNDYLKHRKGICLAETDDIFLDDVSLLDKLMKAMKL